MIKEFDGDIKTLAQEPCVVDVWAEWCGPCKATGKNLETFVEEHPNITIYKINAEQFTDFAEQFKIMSLPTILYFKGGEEVWRHVGLMTAKQLTEKLGL